MNTYRQITAICILVLGILISGCGSVGSSGPVRLVSLATGGYHTCVLTSTGGIKCWGKNDEGQLGDGTMIQQTTPVDVIGITGGASAIAAGAYHTCALTTGGGVKCWGRNVFGNMGDGTTQQRLKPVDVVGLSSGVTAISVSGDHSCALTSTGGVKCWGYNGFGELGDGTTTKHLTPMDVIGLTKGVIAIAAGGNHVCALTTGGGVKCWGNNYFGQLGDGTNTHRPTPVQVSGLTSGVVAITSGGSQSCALTSAGVVKCWGRNDRGELGNGKTLQQAAPVDVIGLTDRITAISAGFFHTCALTSVGGVKCWGDDADRQLGDGKTNHELKPVDVSGLTSVMSAISAGGTHTCALTSGSRIECWGNNDDGELGDGTITLRFAPVDVIGVLTKASTATPAAKPTTTVEPTPIPYPTLIPTIEPTKIPGLLQSSLSVETLDALKGHNLQRVTGWKNGFNSGLWNNDFAGYQWMDANHLLLFPVVGQTQQPDWTTILARPAVINLDTGKVWLPPSDQPEEGNRMLRILMPRWSPDLGILITTENVGVGNDAKLGVTTNTSDGKLVTHYPGKLVDVSPSGDKMLIAGDIWVDLRSGKTVDFKWGSGDPKISTKWLPIWSPDETRVYRCCYFYGNVRTGESYTISNEDTIVEGKPLGQYQSMQHSYGLWLNDNYVMAQGDALYTGPFGIIPIFDITARTFRNLGKIADLPDEFNNETYASQYISPNRDYMWISPGAQSQIDPQVYLVDLKTLKSQLYHSSGLEWSANGKYALLDSQVLTLSNKELRSLPALPGSAPRYLVDSAWHPTEGIRCSITADQQRQHETLNLLDVQSLSYRQVSLPTDFVGDFMRQAIFWSPHGDYIAMLAADNSLWQIDYPKLGKLEQLTPPMADVKEVIWSPDGTHLSFIMGSDIYIVDTKSNP